MNWQNYRAHRSETKSAQLRLVWAIAGAQGAALVALIGVIGRNMPDLDAFLGALGPPMICFGVGLFVALSAIQRNIVAAAKMEGVAVLEDQSDRLLDEASKLPVDVFQPLDLSGAKLIYGDQTKAEAAYLELVHGRLLRQKERDEEHAKEWAQTDEALKEAHRGHRAAVRVTDLLQSLSIGLGVAGFLWFAALPFVGHKPQSRIEHPVAESKAASPNKLASQQSQLSPRKPALARMPEPPNGVAPIESAPSR